MGLPARGEGGGEVAVAGAVDLLDPGVQPGDGFLAVGGRELPPRGRRARAVAVGVGVVVGGGGGGWSLGELGQGGLVLAQGVAEVRGGAIASRCSSSGTCSRWR